MANQMELQYEGVDTEKLDVHCRLLSRPLY